LRKILFCSIIAYQHATFLPDYGNVLVKVVVILGLINGVPAAIPEHNVFCYSAVAHIWTPTVNLAFGLQK